MESANIIVNKNLLPHDPPEAVNDPSGIRIGVQEMTRFGMKEGEMEDIAGLMKEILIDRKDINEMRKKVIEMRSRYLEVKYALSYDLSNYNSKMIPMIL